MTMSLFDKELMGTTSSSCVSCSVANQSMQKQGKTQQQRNSSKIVPRRRISRMDTPSTVWRRYFETLEVSGVEKHSYFP
jgi:hypothetical protein